LPKSIWLKSTASRRAAREVQSINELPYAYLFTVLRWSPRVAIELSKWADIEAYLDRVAARPKVKEAMKAEGLLQ
jgi:hypothetical protein